MPSPGPSLAAAGRGVLRQDANVLLAAPSSGAIPPITDELPFKVVARAMNLLIARGAYREAARIYPEDLIELRQGARIIEKSLADEARCESNGAIKAWYELFQLVTILRAQSGRRP